MRKNKKANRQPSELLQTNTHALVRGFLITFFVCAFLSMELCILTRGKYFQYSLFWNGAISDHFMDFFNTMRDTWDLSWIYQRNTIYPPLSVLFTHLFSHMIPEDLAAIRFLSRYTMQYSQLCVLLFFMLACTCVLWMAKMMDIYIAKRDTTISDMSRYLTIVFLTISFPFVYCLERGNTSFVTVAFCMFFLFFRNSENKVVRELSYISLAIAAGLKMFPAFLGIILLYDRKYFPAIRTIFYGLSMFILPYLLMQVLAPEDGLKSQVISEMEAGLQPSVDTDGTIERFFANLFIWNGKERNYRSNTTSIVNLALLLRNVFFLSDKLTRALSNILFVVTEALAFFAGFFCKKDWQKMFFASYLMLNIGSATNFYTLLYLLPVFVVFLFEKDDENGKRTKRQWIYLACFGVMLIPIPNLLYPFENQINAAVYAYFGFKAANNINKDLSFYAFQILFFVLLADVFITAIKSYKKNPKKIKMPKKKKKETAGAAA